MKNKMIFPLLMLLLIVLAACSPAAEQQPEAVPVVEAGAPSDVISDAAGGAAGGSIELANECDEPGAGLHLLNFPAQGICFLYPEQYELFQEGEDSSIAFFIRSIFNTEAPSFSVEFEPVDGRTLEEIAEQYIATYAFPDTPSSETTLGGERAILIDNIPGQDASRRVITIHNDVVYQLSVLRVGADYGEVGEQAEALFSQLTSSFEFVPVETDKPMVAGPECPAQLENSLLYTNEIVGYCLLLPAEYQALEISAEAGNNEMAFYVDSLQEVNQPHLWIKVTDANGLSLEEVTMAHEAEIEGGFEGYDVQWSFGYLVDGVFANQFEQVPGQDLGRELIIVHNDQIFTLTLTPDDPEAGDVYSEMEALFEMVLDSFSFISN